MAKRSGPRSQADDLVAGAPAAQPRARRSRARTGPTNGDAETATAAVTAPLNSSSDNLRPIELDPEPAVPQLTRSRDVVSKWQPTEDDIRLRAYHRFLERGGGHGQAFDDWLEAERELKLRG
jgi:DUF2934 family protein